MLGGAPCLGSRSCIILGVLRKANAFRAAPTHDLFPLGRPGRAHIGTSSNCARRYGDTFFATAWRSQNRTCFAFEKYIVPETMEINAITISCKLSYCGVSVLMKHLCAILGAGWVVGAVPCASCSLCNYPAYMFPRSVFEQHRIAS